MKTADIKKIVAAEHPDWEVLEDDDRWLRDSADLLAAPPDVTSELAEGDDSSRSVEPEPRARLGGSDEETLKEVFLRVRTRKRGGRAARQPEKGGVLDSVDDDQSSRIVRLRTPDGSVMRALVGPNGIIARQG